MDSKTKILKESTWAFIAKLTAVAGGLFFTIYIPKFAGADAYGLFSLTTAYITLLGIFTGVQLNSAINEEVTKYKVSDISRDIFWESIKLKVILTTAVSIALFSVLYFKNNESVKSELMLFIALLLVMNVWGLVVSYFECIHRLINEAMMYLIEYALQIGLIVYFSFSNNFNIHTILVSYLTGYIGSLLFGFILLFQTSPYFLNIKWLSLNIPIAKKLLVRTLYLSLTSISLIILTKIDTVMIGWLLDAKAVGHYAIASDVVKGSVILSMPIILGVMPLFYETDEKTFVKRNTKILISINLVFALSILILSGPFVEFVYGANFQEVKEVMMILALFPLLSTLQTFAQRVLILKGKQIHIFLSGLTAVGFNIILNLTLIPLMGITGAAISTITAYSLWVLINYRSMLN